jgi:hypothetical protein
MYWLFSHVCATPEFFKGDKVKGFPVALYRRRREGEE